MVKARTGAMHVVRVVSRQGGREYVSTLLRNSYREDGKVKKQTLANLSHLPEPLIELIGGWLRGERVAVKITATDAFVGTQPINVNAFDDLELVGGVTLYVHS